MFGDVDVVDDVMMMIIIIIIMRKVITDMASNLGHYSN
jgi:hypothetical protein